jgi:8-oxo-dGTP pyrophosphatase MutT (NUDIX family)
MAEITAKRFTIRAAVYLVLIKDNQVLLARRYKTGWEDGKYSMVAGHLDGAESVSTALAREVIEECGISIDPPEIRIIHTMHRNSGDFEYIDFFGTTDKWQGEPKILEPDKCDDLQWFSLDRLPGNLLPHVRHALDCIKNGIIFSEFGWENRLPG